MSRDKKSLCQILTNHLKEKAGIWVHAGDLERVAQANGYEAETGKRRLREMTQFGHANYNHHIQKQKDEKGRVWYGYYDEQPQPVRRTSYTFFSASQQDKTYQVQDLGHVLVCDCPGYHFRGTCKHVKEVEKQKFIKYQNSLFATNG